MPRSIIILSLVFILTTLIIVASIIYFSSSSCNKNCTNKKCGDNDGCKGKCQTGKCADPNTKCIKGVCTKQCVPDCKGYTCGLDPVCGTKDCGPCDGTCTEGVCVKSCQADCKGNTCGPDPVCGTEDCGSCSEPGSYCNNGQCSKGCAGCQPNEQCNLLNVCVSKPGTNYYIRSKNGVDSSGKPLFVYGFNYKGGGLSSNPYLRTLFTVYEIDESGYELLDKGITVQDNGNPYNIRILSVIENNTLNHYATYWDGNKYSYLNVHDGPGTICTIGNLNNTCPSQTASTTPEKAAIVKVF